MSDTATSSVCRKARFATERDAWRRLLEIALLEPARCGGPKPCRAYFCRVCWDWHLTRRPQ